MLFWEIENSIERSTSQYCSEKYLNRTNPKLISPVFNYLLNLIESVDYGIKEGIGELVKNTLF